MHRFNNILLWIQLDTNLFELGMQKNQHYIWSERYFVPALLRNLRGGGH